MVAFLPFFIIGIIITAIGFVIYAYLEKAQRPLKVDMDVPLPMFKESHAVSGRLNSTTLKNQNISETYERMCILEPVKYQNDPTLSKVISDYKALLQGKLLDPEGLHVPSETINDFPNPDYQRYLKAQRKALKLSKKISGRTAYDKELRRLDIVDKEEDIRVQFILELGKLGLSEVAVSALMSDTKLNKFKAEEWKRLAKKVKGYSETYDESVVFSFLSHIDDISILLDENKLDQYNTYVCHGAPEAIALEIITDGISQEQAVRAARLVDRHSYDWTDAVTEVLETDLKVTTEKTLRNKYQSMTRG